MTGDALLDLLPALYRVRDTEVALTLGLLTMAEETELAGLEALSSPTVEQQGRLRELYEKRERGPLASLLAVIAEQVAAIEENLDQLYDDQFIETAAEWAAPYIGDLIGYRPLHGVIPRLSSPRAEVANTIAYRRRKGTASMLEQLARDVTGWPARAVEFFERVGWTQYMNHVRPEASYAPDLRRSQQLLWHGGAFDTPLHTIDVRRVQAGGRYNIPNVGLFLCRLGSFSLTRSPAAADPLDPEGRLLRFDPLGIDTRLFTDPVTEDEITHLAEPLDLPIPIELRWMAAHRDQYYGRGKSVFLERAGAAPGDPPEPIAEADIRVCNLGDIVDGGGNNVTGWAHVPAPGSGEVAIDPVLGRIALGDAPSRPVLVSYHYGLPAPIGGGEYERGVTSLRFGAVRQVRDGTALQSELAGPTSGTVEVADSRRYAAPGSIQVEPDSTLVWRAANGTRPCIESSSDIVVTIGPRATLILDGLLINGATLRVPDYGDEEPRTLVLRHCTFVPGSQGTSAAGLVVEHPFTAVQVEACVLAPLHVVEDAEVSMRDSIIDATGQQLVAYRGPADDLAPGGALTLENVTVIGKVHTRQVEATNVLFVARLDAGGDAWKGPFWADRRQAGCLRFCFVPTGSRTPRQYQCEPAEGGDVSLWPAFTSLRYGDAGYCQLALGTSEAIGRGAEDESEIGAFHLLFQPQRETNLRLRLDEYLRFGLEAGIFYAT
jgi:hypothetical protein